MAKIGAVYVGTVVGAGFASGQEVLRFFTAFGGAGTWGLAAAGLMFALFGWAAMEVGQAVGARSHAEVVRAILGPGLGPALDWGITLFLYAIVVLMAAGAGAVFSEQYGLPAGWGSLVMIAAATGTVLFGFAGVVRSIAIVAPALVAAVLLLGLLTVLGRPIPPAVLGAMPIAHAAAPAWPLASVLYVSFNLILALAVLGPLGADIDQAEARAMGAWIGGVGLALAAAAIHLAILATWPESGRVDVPMLAVARGVSPLAGALYSGVLLAEVYTTAVSSLYGFSVRLFSGTGWGARIATLLAAGVAFGLSQVGFTRMVLTVLPAAGYAGLLLLAGLGWWMITVWWQARAAA
ncbi:MAG TPA: hypothetical protein VF234_09660 [Limnochordia bacterium]